MQQKTVIVGHVRSYPLKVVPYIINEKSHISTIVPPDGRSGDLLLQLHGTGYPILYE